MNNCIQLNESISVGGQPTVEELDELSKQGFRAVLNLREQSEQGGLSPDEEGEKVRELGMIYAHVPVSMKALNDEVVRRMHEVLAELPAPVFVHCAQGKRAGAVAMMHTATVEGMTGEETLQKAGELGFECDPPKLAEFIKSYVDRYRAHRS